MPLLGRTLKRRLTAGFLLVGGAALVLTGLWLVAANANFLRHAETAPGTVTDIVERRDIRGTKIFHPIIRYRPRRHGRSIMFKVTPGHVWASPFDVGDRVTVAYSEGDPEDAKILSFWMLWSMPAVLMLFGAGSFVAGRQIMAKTE